MSRCMRHPKKLATWPSKVDCDAQGFTDARFCSLHCAALYALTQTVDDKWCPKHKCWHSEGCDGCNMDAEKEYQELEGT